MPIGAGLACADSIYPNWLNTETRHGIMAFGGGALISAVALVLVPEGAESLSVLPASISFAAGGVGFLALDVFLARTKSPSGQLAAMLSDFIPEAIALGAAFASTSTSGTLLAALIAIQNLPEGFNAYREMTDSGSLRGSSVVSAFIAMSLLGPVAGLAGYFWLSQFPAVLASMMLFASGGILYLVFQDIAPNAKIRNRWSPALGAVAGFLLGLIGNMIVDHG